MSNKNYINELSDKLANDLRPFKEKLKNTCYYSLVPRPPLERKILLILLLKTRGWTFHAVSSFP